MRKIKISILMPAYNSEQFISRSIESIINQSFLDYEFIIIDDGSKDATKEIINMYKQNNNKIKLFRWSWWWSWEPIVFISSRLWS